MINNNKILTVSYGTFSCTLEGFDDSFETMKAIAEYFRDLAADDRFFGAEPPQPDAEMLARIAEREMSRRVEASEHEGRILLKAHEATAMEEAPAPEPAPAPFTEAAPAAAAATAPPAANPDAATAAPDTAPWQGTYTPDPQPPADSAHLQEAEPAQPFAIDTAHSAPVGTEAPAGADDFFAAGVPAPVAGDLTRKPRPARAEPDDHTAQAPGADSISDRLARIRAVVSRQVVVTETTGIYDEEESVPAAASAVSFEAMGIEADADDVPRDGGVTPADDPLSGVARDIENALDADDQTMAEAAEAEPFEEEEDDLSAVLSRIEAGAPVQEDYDDEDADELTAAPETGATAEEEGIPFSPGCFATSDASVEDETPDDAGDADEIVEDQLSAEIDGEDGSALISDADAQEDDELILTTDELSGDAPDEATQDHAEAETMQAVDDARDTGEEIDETEEPPFAGAMSREFVSEEVQSEDPAEDEAGADEHVFVSESYDEIATGTDIGSEDDATDADETATQKVAEDVPADHDLIAENDLPEADASETDEEAAVTGRVMKVNSAELEDALESGELEDLDNEGDDDTEARRHAGRANLPDISGVSGDDVTRLMAEADQQMEEPEGATRRSAFAHLRAAVAARFADKTMGSEAEAEETAEAYRSDLAEVVRPRRPVNDGNATNRPADKTTAPLKLVAEQRVDTDDARGPVAPRRIAAGGHEEDELSEDTGFAAFASEMGATSLPELLEAAAAYLSFVEGQEDFSRPQLMTRVRQASEGSEFTREDGLRSFGQLLRSGKIEKMKGGRFAASEDIGFKPDARAAG